MMSNISKIKNCKLGKKKMLLIAGATASAICILVAGTLSLFTARVQSNQEAKAGTVNISISNMDLTNRSNINPGDNDPDIAYTATHGTDHTFTYTVNNDGNKSVRTRQTLILTANNGDLDARYLELLNDNKEIGSKVYVLKDGSEKTAYNTNDIIKAIKYTFISDTFDGKGTDLSLGGDAEKENLSSIIKENENGDVSQSYSYDFALLSTATNAYQNAAFNVDVVVEAMQYRNTETTDWSAASKVQRTYSNVDLNVAPAADENKTNNYKN